MDHDTSTGDLLSNSTPTDNDVTDTAGTPDRSSTECAPNTICIGDRPCTLTRTSSGMPTRTTGPTDPPAPVPNTAPVAGDDGPFTLEAGASVDIAVAALLANDQDADGDALALGTVSASGGSVVRLDVGGTDTIRFTADDTAGAASLTYTVSDGRGGSDTATVALEVTAPPPPDDPVDPPVENPDAIALLDAPQVFDGTSAVVVDHDAAFETDSGAITITFQAASTDGRQGLFSKDSSGYDDGGHLTLTIENGILRLRAQTTDQSFDIQGGAVTAGSVNTVTAAWADGTLSLSLNGTEIGSMLKSLRGIGVALFITPVPPAGATPPRRAHRRTTLSM